MRSVAYLPLALAGLVSAAAPAFAQTAAESPYAPFTGPRIEGIVGWDRIQADGHKDDLMYGVAAGYDIQMGGVLLGAEAEYADSDNRICAGEGTSVDNRLCIKAARDLYAGGRIGTVLGSRTLLYAKAGYTNARIKLTADDGNDEVTLDHANLDGVRVGAGAEFKLASNAYVKGEYRYSNYESGFERHQVVGGVGLRF